MTDPSGHLSHFVPEIPILHTHLPVICSQSLRIDPKREQLHPSEKNCPMLALLSKSALKIFFSLNISHGDLHSNVDYP